MKTTKRLLSCLLVLAMLFALAIPAFAAGGHTLTIKNAQKGATYQLYKVFNATPTADGNSVSYQLAVTAPAEGNAFYTYFRIDSTGNVHPLDKAVEGGKLNDDPAKNILTQAAADALYEVVKNTTPKTATESNGTAVFENLDDGYYIVVKIDGEGATAKPAAWLSVDTITGDEEIYDKNPSKPTPDGDLKTFTSNYINKDKTEATAKIGETVSFEVKFNATQYVTEDEDGQPTQNPEAVKYYTITDTAENINIDLTTISVKVGDNNLTKDTDYTVAQSGKDTVIVIDWQQKTDNEYNGTFKYNNNVAVVVAYNGTVKATTGTNAAKVNHNGDPDPVIPGNTVTVKTFNANVLKYDSADQSKAVLNGAQFRLYEEETGGAALLFEKSVDANKHVTYTLTDKTSTEEGVSDIIEAGNITVAGLKGGTITLDDDGEIVGGTVASVYYLEEIQAPSGYNPVETRQKIEFKTTNNASAVGVEIGNAKGTVLPSTGGIGTTMFYVVGGLLVAAAVVVLVSKKRMGAEQ